MLHEITKNSALSRFELPINEDAVAAAYYREEDGVVVLVHTEVPFEYAGQGFATRLADGVFASLRATNEKVRPRCEFMARYATQHPEFNDLIRW
jgi:predicted GNAT family acetyltransferase